MPRSRATRFVPAVSSLESRDVPATFYVDTQFAGLANGTVATFDQSAPTSVAGVVIGTDGFAALNDALTAAAANAEADTIRISRTRDTFGTPTTLAVDNSAGAVTLDDNLTFIGSGSGATILAPTADTADTSTGIFEILAGRTVTFQDLSLTGIGVQAGIGFNFNGFGSTGVLRNVAVTNISFGATDGVAVAAGNTSVLTVENSDISQYGRIGVLYAFATGAVTNSRITGWGGGTTFVNYGIQLAGAAAVEITGNTITANTPTLPTPELSAAVNMFEIANAAPTATITRNTITNNTFGIRVGGEFGVDRSQASIHTNNLQANYLAIQADNNATVDATGNWFGDATGPLEITTNQAGRGSEVTDQVDYANWLTTAFVPTVTVTVPVPVQVPVPVPVPVVPLPPAPVVPLPVVVPPPGGVAVGGAGSARLLTANLSTGLTVTPFDGKWSGEVKVARADVTGDDTADLIVAVGFGGGPRVEVYDGATGARVRNFYAFAPVFAGGVSVAAADVNKDGYADIIAGAGLGGSPTVRVFDGKTGAMIRQFLAFPEEFTGGVNVAGGDVTGDGYADIITGAGVGGDPYVRVFDGQSGAMVRQFLALAPGFTGGVNVAAGDVTNRGYASIVVAAGAGGGPVVQVYDGKTGQRTASFYADAETASNGMSVAMSDLDGDGKADIATAGAGSDGKVRVTFGKDLTGGNPSPTLLSQAFNGAARLNVG